SDLSIIKSGFALAICSTFVLSIFLESFVTSFNTLFCLTNSGTATGLCPNFTNAPTYVGCNTTIRLGSFGTSTFSPESFVNDLVSDLMPSDSLLFSSVLLFAQAAISITKTIKKESILERSEIIMEWLIGLLGEDILFNYLTFSIHYFIPILLTLLFVYLEMQASIKLNETLHVQPSTEVQDQYIFVWMVP